MVAATIHTSGGAMLERTGNRICLVGGGIHQCRGNRRELAATAGQVAQVVHGARRDHPHFMKKIISTSTARRVEARSRASNVGGRRWDMPQATRGRHGYTISSGLKSHGTQVRRHRHGSKRADVGPSRIALGNPHPGKHGRGERAGDLAK